MCDKILNYALSDIIKQKVQNLIKDQKFNDILTGSAWALFGQIMSAGMAMLASIIIARFYGAEILGIVAVLNSFFILTTVFTVLGTGTSILRLIPEHLVKYSPKSAFKLYQKCLYIIISVSIFASALFFFSSELLADKFFKKPHLSFYFGLGALFIVFQIPDNIKHTGCAWVKVD